MINKVKQWAIDRELHVSSPHAQMTKVLEEVVELNSALLQQDQAEIIDALGDTYVTLIILAMQLDLDLEECLEVAYNEIKGRTGRTVNGVFIKDEA